MSFGQNEFNNDSLEQEQFQDENLKSPYLPDFENPFSLIHNEEYNISIEIKENVPQIIFYNKKFYILYKIYSDWIKIKIIKVKKSRIFYP